MFGYSRKISFIEYYRSGIKTGTMGVVRQKGLEKELELSVDLFDLEEDTNVRCKISMGNGRIRREIGEVEIEKGKGSTVLLLPYKRLIPGQDEKIFFMLGTDCVGIANLYISADMIYCGRAETEYEAQEKMPEESGQSEICEEDGEKGKGECVETIENAQECESEDRLQQENELLMECLESLPDKWEQIKKKYPILYPFKGQGAYVSIKPVDLKLLNEKYHDLSDNSYLMHGFYKYKHMILGEYSQEKGSSFYVGVPGEFIVKEQTAASMFGFEGYEHSGDMGYYLYRVEL